MSCEIELSPSFKKEAKRLSKKYASLKEDLAELFHSLETDPTQGTPLGNNIFKIRLRISSKGKGKSGGARVITFVKVHNLKIILLTIYNKGEQSNITDREIQEILRDYL